jgi:hypothetical protein
MENNNTNKKWWKVRLFVPEGAFLFWLLKGFKGKFEDEYNKNYFRNVITTIILWIVIIYLLFHNKGFKW